MSDITYQEQVHKEMYGEHVTFKDCPFCGSSDISFKKERIVETPGYRPLVEACVGCNHCGASVLKTQNSEAFKTWNNRVPTDKVN